MSDNRETDVLLDFVNQSVAEMEALQFAEDEHQQHIVVILNPAAPGTPGLGSAHGPFPDALSALTAAEALQQRLNAGNEDDPEYVPVRVIPLRLFGEGKKG
ncbi:MAG TPA: hypothetical protein VJ742_12630 [Nitrososphaera sp.]|nr:hypothetical protein [Nitrososphaera sp.]